MKSQNINLKIAIFHLAFVYSGGGEKLVLEEAEGLLKKGHSVDLYVPVIKKETCFPDLLDKFSVHTFIPQWFSSHETFQVLITALVVPLFAYKFRKYDVILAANQPSPWIAWIIKKMFGVPYVSYLAQPTRYIYPRDIDKDTGLRFTKHSSSSLTTKIMNFGFNFIKWADKVSIQGSNKILSNGEYIRRVLKKTYRVIVTSCPAGAIADGEIVPITKRMSGRLKVNGFYVDKPFILLTNRHFSQKRFEYGIIALSHLLAKCPEFELIITGEETEYTDEIKLLVSRLSLNSKVHFLGYVKEKNLDLLYRNACVYIYTAPEEDFGMGITEAMSHGTPVVAWNYGGPSKTVIHKKTGLLTTPYEVGEFAENCVAIVKSPVLAEKLSREALKHIRINYSRERHISILENALFSVLPRTKKPVLL